MITLSPTSAINNLLLSLGLSGKGSSVQGLLAAGKSGFTPIMNGENPAGQTAGGAKPALPQAFRLLPNGKIAQTQSAPAAPNPQGLQKQQVSGAAGPPASLINATILPEGLVLSPVTAPNVTVTPAVSTPGGEALPALPETGLKEPVVDGSEAVAALVSASDPFTKPGIVPPIINIRTITPSAQPQQLTAPAAPEPTVPPSVQNPQIITPALDGETVAGQTTPQAIAGTAGKTTTVPALANLDSASSPPTPEIVQGLTQAVKNAVERKNPSAAEPEFAEKTIKTNGATVASQGQTGQTTTVTAQNTGNNPASPPGANIQTVEPGQAAPAGQSAIPAATADAAALPPEGQLNPIQQASNNAHAAYGRNGLPPSPVTHQVGLQITKAVAEGKSAFTIRIDPPELGRVEVRLDFGTEGRMKAHLVAENKEALELLQRDHRVLERALTDAGVKTDSASLNFSLKQQGGQASAQQGSHGQDGTGNASNKDSQEAMALLGDDLDEQIASGTLLSDRVLDIRI